MLRSRRPLAIAAAIVVIGGLAAGIHFRLRAAEGTEEESATAVLEGAIPSAASAFASDLAIPVTGVKAVRGTLVISVQASGQAEASRRTVVTPQVQGRIREVHVRESQQLGEGTALLTLDPVEYELAVSEAEVALRNAEASYREMTLFDDAITDPEARAERERFARSRSGLEQAELALQRARLELERTRVRAPIAGRVANLQVVPGEWVGPSTELMTIVDVDPIEVEVRVLEGEVGYLAVGRNARVSFSAFPGEVFAGRVESINPVVDAGTRTARVTVIVPNPGGRILPGMYASVAIDAREFPDRVMVPRTAILERGEDRRTMLFVYEGDEEGGRAMWRYVTPGLENETQVEILADVETDSVRAGEIVLTDGHYTLIHNARVRIEGPPAR